MCAHISAFDSLRSLSPLDKRGTGCLSLPHLFFGNSLDANVCNWHIIYGSSIHHNKLKYEIKNQSVDPKCTHVRLCDPIANLAIRSRHHHLRMETLDKLGNSIASYQAIWVKRSGHKEMGLSNTHLSYTDTGQIARAGKVQFPMRCFSTFHNLRTELRF